MHVLIFPLGGKILLYKCWKFAELVEKISVSVTIRVTVGIFSEATVFCWFNNFVILWLLLSSAAICCITWY